MKAASILGLAVCAVAACSAPRQIKQDYTPVPVESAVGDASDEQKEILSRLGQPSVIWSKSLGIIEWVYCKDGSPERVFDFDEYGQQLGGGFGGNRSLCTRSGSRRHDSRRDDGLRSPAPADYGTLLKRAQTYFAQRSTPGMAKKALVVAEEALRQRPSDFEAALLTTRTIAYLAVNMRPDTRRKWLAYRGYKIGKQLILYYPGRVEGYYFAAFNLELFAECGGFFPLAHEKTETKIAGLLDQAMRVDRKFMRGAPLLARARYLILFGRFTASKTEAQKLIEEVKQSFPGNPRADLLDAELAISVGKMDRARELLKSLIGKLPDGAEDHAAGVTIRRRAAKLLKSLSEKR